MTTGSWREELIHSLSQTNSAEHVFAQTVARAKALGFEHCSYGLCFAFPITQPQVRILDTYPAPWRVRYREQGYVSTDPTVLHGMKSPMPVVWEALSAHNRRLWEEARGHGLVHGWSRSSRGGLGVIGVFSVCRDVESISVKELDEIEPHLVWLSEHAHLGISQRLTAQAVPRKALSAREIEVLRWTADGKTAAEIGAILQLTERTVNFHVGNVTEKLGVSNKTAAVLRAAMFGWLS